MSLSTVTHKKSTMKLFIVIQKKNAMPLFVVTDKKNNHFTTDCYSQEK